LRTWLKLVVAAGVIVAVVVPTVAADDSDEAASRLVAAMLSPTPLIDDLRDLTDRIGGRATGSAANERSVEWALERFRDAGVDARSEAFEMPKLWLEREASAAVSGPGINFAPRIAGMPFSAPTPPGGLGAALVDAGDGSAEEFARLGDTARGAFALVGQPMLEDVAGLFAEYIAASAIEERAFAAGVAGLVYMGSRPGDQLYRHNASYGVTNDHVMIVVERDAATRMRRLLRSGTPLELRVDLRLATSGPYTSHNVIGEIRGGDLADEIVVIGAHLDSWDLGTGALDNGCNVALVIDLARQIRRLGLTPRRTIRFALWNGEEQGLFGSWAYVQAHEDELGRHVMVSSFDTGSGRIRGFVTNGRMAELRGVLDAALEPVAGLGPFEHTDAAYYGTDHFDFVLEGVAGFFADQESANYGENYHARGDTFDKVNQEQVRLNAAVTAAFAWGFANAEIGWGRLERAEVQTIIDAGLGEQMRAFRVMDAWESGERGRPGS
jgi:carboxypeptidase Q